MDAVIVPLIVLAALAFLGRRIWRSVQASRPGSAAGCADGCGCTPPPQPRRHEG